MKGKCVNKTGLIGIICGLMTGICWGVSGVFGQFLFETRNIETTWLVPIRLSTAGVLLCIWSLVKNREETVRLVKSGRDLLQTLAAGVFGTMMFQLTFFGTVQRSNAGTATILQYLCPLMVMIYVCAREKRLPKGMETVSVILAIAGVFLISTHGHLGELAISTDALIWGIGCAFFMFLSTVIPESLYDRHPSSVVTALAILTGGIVLSLILRPWTYSVKIDAAVLISLFFIIIGGSVAAYVFYAHSIRLVGPERASLCATIEPVVATVFAALWLKTPFHMVDLIGFACILATVIILNTTPSEKTSL